MQNILKAILNFLKDNWFKIGLLLVILYVGTQIVDEIHKLDLSTECQCECECSNY